MKKSVSTFLKLAIFLILTIMGIFYIINRPPVKSIGEYKKQEMVKPNRNKSFIDQLFKPDSSKRKNAAEDDDVSLTGRSGRYKEARVGKSTEE